MEVGSIREKIIIALLIYKFGENNVEINIPTTQADVDVQVFNEPISIKTITGKRLHGVKLIWTVDQKKASQFQQSYVPGSDMLLIQVNWDNGGWFYLFPKSVQVEIFLQVGAQKYIKLPKSGTNPRGVEISEAALCRLANHKDSRKIPINWVRPTIDYHPHERWLALWQKDQKD
jgi:hypothetical protein